MMSQTETDSTHHRYEMEFKHTVRGRAIVRRHDNQQLVLTGVCLADVVDDGNVIGLRSFQIVCPFVASLQQQGGRFTVDESKDAVVHVFNIACYRPVESLLKRIKRPKSGIVALSSYDLMGTNHSSHLTSQIVCASDMS